MNLIVSGQWFPEYSGVGNRIKKVYDELNIDYVVISGVWKDPIVKNLENRCKYIKKYNFNMNDHINNKIIKKLLYLLNLILIFAKIPFSLREIRNRFGHIDTIHTLNGGGFLYYYVVFWSNYIFDSYTIVVECKGGDGYKELLKNGEKAFGTKILAFLGKYVFTYVFNKADHIIYASEHLKTDIPNNKSIKYVRNAFYDQSEFHPVDKRNKNILKDKYDIPKDKKIFLTIGMVNTLKNQYFISQVLNGIKCNDWVWLVVGTSNDVSDYTAMISATVGYDKIKYINQWSNSPYEYYQLSDIYLFSSIREGNNNSVNEALMCGLPIILLDNGCYSHLKPFENKFSYAVNIVNDNDEFAKSVDMLVNYSTNHTSVHTFASGIYNKENYYKIYHESLMV